MANRNQKSLVERAAKQQTKKLVKKAAMANPVVTVCVVLAIFGVVLITGIILMLVATVSSASSTSLPPGVCADGSDDQTSVTPAKVILHFAGVKFDGATLDPQQKSIALTIAGTTKGEGGSRRDAQLLLMVAYQESTYHDEDHGDAAGPDSLGPFQQRASWGPAAVRMSIVGATKLAYAALIQIPNRDSLSLFDEAIELQHPDPGVHGYSEPGHAFLDWEVPVDMMLGNTYGPPLPKATVPANTIPTVTTASDPTESDPCVSVVSNGEYGYPLSPMPDAQIGCPFQGTHTYYHNWQSDNAVDLPTPVGTLVIAVADGVIGPRIGAFNTTKGNLLGQRVTLETDGNDFYYMHLSQLVVVAGQHVKKGDPLGYSGKSGAAHLHFAMHAEFNVADAIGMTPTLCPDSNWAWPSYLPRDTTAENGTPLKSS